MSQESKLMGASPTSVADPSAAGSPLQEPAVERLLNKTFTPVERFITRRGEARTIAEHRAASASEILGAKLEQIRIARRTAENKWRLEASAFLAVYSGELHRRVATQLEAVQAALLKDMGEAETRVLNDFGQQLEDVENVPEQFREGQRKRLSERLDRHLRFIEEDLVNAAYERLRKIREAFPVV